MITTKYEILSTKSETNLNDQNPKLKTECLEHFENLIFVFIYRKLNNARTYL
jgi:hypothetical protein